MLSKNKRTYLAMSVLFVLSGLTSLVFQSIWIRSVALAVGSTTESVSLVLSIFFFGLALGSYKGGAFARRTQRPVRLYGYLEAAIGLYAIASIYGLIHFQKLMSFFPLDGSFTILGQICKIALVVFLLLPPALCMGATLPILTRAVTDSPAGKARMISLLYGINTLGAALGALSTGFVLIPAFGLIATNHGIAIINLFIGAAAFVLDRNNRQLFTSLRLDNSEVAKLSKSSLKKLRQSLSNPYSSLLCLAAACGASSISAEVVWSKYLSIFVGSNIFGLSIVMSIYLFGIAIGAILLSVVMRRFKNHELLLLVLTFLTVVSTLASSYLINYAPVISASLAFHFRGIFSLLAIKSLVSAFLLFMPTCFFGMLFPLIIALISNRRSDAERVVGTVYAVNTTGAIAGSCLAGLLLVPMFGSTNTMRFSIVVLLAAMFYTSLQLKSLGRLRFAGVAAALVLFAAILAVEPMRFDNIIRAAYLSSIGPNDKYEDVMKVFAPEHEEFKLIVEGKTGLISLSHTQGDGPHFRDYLRLKTSGLNESVYAKGYLEYLPKYEALLAALPYSLVPQAESAFIVGYGGGFTVDLMSQLKIPKVDVVELEKGILEAADYVYGGSNPILMRDNVSVRIDDARYVLAAKIGGPYDIIVSQPSHSWLAGVANLFTLEFFEIVRANLTERGIYSQWLNLYNMDPKVLKSILKTFYSVFPHGQVFTDLKDQELIMIGSKAPLQMNLSALKQLAEDPKMARALYYLPFKSPHDLASLALADRDVIVKATKNSVINTDVNAFAEVSQSRIFYNKGQSYENTVTFLRELMQASFPQIIQSRLLTNWPDAGYNLLLSLYWRSSFEKFYALFAEYERGAPQDGVSLQRLGHLALLAQRYDSAVKYLNAALAAGAGASVLNELLTSLIHSARYEDALTASARHKKVGDEISACYAFYAGLRATGLTSASQKQAKELSSATQAHEGRCGSIYHLAFGYYHFLKADHKTAVKHLERYIVGQENDVEALRLMMLSHSYLNQETLVTYYASRLASAREASQMRIKTLAKYYRDAGMVDDARVLEARIGAAH